MHFLTSYFLVSLMSDQCLPLCAGADGWELGFPMGRARISQYLSDAHQPPLSSGFPLTVKDLLLSGTPEPVGAAPGLFGRVSGVGTCGTGGGGGTLNRCLILTLFRFSSARLCTLAETTKEHTSFP